MAEQEHPKTQVEGPEPQCGAVQKISCGCCADIDRVRCEKNLGHKGKHKGSDEAGGDSSWAYKVTVTWPQDERGE